MSEWANLIEEGLTEDVLHFSRSTRPPYAVKLPKLIGYFDGSSQAYASVVYVR